MKKLFLTNEVFLQDQTICVDGEVHHHLANVLRVKVGEEFIVGDLNNTEFVGKIAKIEKKATFIKLVSEYKREKSYIPSVTLFFPILKGDKVDDIVRMCSEIGVTNFVPVITNNCIVKINEENSKNKIKRWQTIAKESSMQSGRFEIPKIFPITKLNDIENFAIDSLKIVGLIEKKNEYLINILNKNKNFDRISLLMGPEGDFTFDEIKFLKDNFWRGVTLSSNILRSETAIIFTVSSLFFVLGVG